MHQRIFGFERCAFSTSSTLMMTSSSLSTASPASRDKPLQRVARWRR